MPTDTLIPVNRVSQETLPSGTRGEFVFEPDTDGMAVDMVAASKYTGLTYAVSVDDQSRFGPVSIPPTDIDDATTTHNPRLAVRDQLTVTIRNPTTVDREIAVQIRGVEES